MDGRRPNKEMLDALERRIQALELAELSAANVNTRYAIPDIESQKEKSHDNSDIIRDAIIGFADGLTVPFALTAGLSSIGSSKLVIVGGLAELFAGAISMGLGAWLAAITDRKVFEVEEKKQRRAIRAKPAAAEEEIYEVFDEYNVNREAVTPVVDQLIKNFDMWIKFMMDFKHKMEKPDPSRAWISAGVMGMAYFLGGIIPMIPYFAVRDVNTALIISIVITIIILLVFGYTKSLITGTGQKSAFFSAIQTLIVGALAAGASYGIVRGVNASLGGAGVPA